MRRLLMSAVSTEISSATFYKWKGKYGGLGVSDAKRKALEDENAIRAAEFLAISLVAFSCFD